MISAHPPALTGAFYCFNHTKNPTNQAFNTWHHWQQNSHSLHPSSRLIHPQKIQGRANKASAFFSPTSIHIPSTQLPNTSLHVAITDAICSSESHRNLMPVFWNLIEPDVKRKRQLLLPWWHPQSLQHHLQAFVLQWAAAVAVTSRLILWIRLCFHKNASQQLPRKLAFH